MNVVFDFGGVVFNWQPHVLLTQVLPAHAPNEDAARQLAARLFQGFVPGSDWALFDLGQIAPDALALRIAARTGLRVPEVSAVIDAIPPHLVPNPDTVELIRDLREAGHKLFYLSNMPASYADELEQRHAFLSWFESGVFSARVQQIKPNADIFTTATERFGVVGADTVFIDDVLHNIDAAQSHGWHGIHFQSAEQVRAELARRWPQ